MDKKETTSNEIKDEGKFNEACKDYRKFRLKCLIIYMISFVAFLITVFVPTIKVSGEDLYIGYANSMRSLYNDYKSGENIDFDEEKNAEARQEILIFTINSMKGDKNKIDETKEKLSVALLVFLSDTTHILKLLELDDAQFEKTVAEEAKEFAQLSTSYSMFEMGRLMWKETCLGNIFGSDDNDVHIFYVDAMCTFVTLLEYILGIMIAVIEIGTVVILIASIFFSKAVVKKASEKSKKQMCMKISTFGLLFYIPTIIFYFITKSANIFKKSCGVFFKSITLSPLFYVLCAIEAVALVLTFINNRSLNNISYNISKI